MFWICGERYISRALFSGLKHTKLPVATHSIRLNFVHLSSVGDVCTILLTLLIDRNQYHTKSYSTCRIAQNRHLRVHVGLRFENYQILDTCTTRPGLEERSGCSRKQQDSFAPLGGPRLSLEYFFSLRSKAVFSRAAVCHNGENSTQLWKHRFTGRPIQKDLEEIWLRKPIVPSNRIQLVSLLWDAPT